MVAVLAVAIVAALEAVQVARGAWLVMDTAIIVHIVIVATAVLIIVIDVIPPFFNVFPNGFISDKIKHKEKNDQRQKIDEQRPEIAEDFIQEVFWGERTGWSSKEIYAFHKHPGLQAFL